MNKADFRPKVSFIESPKPSAKPEEKASSGNVPTDAYGSQGKNAYKALVSGDQKAEVSIIEEMLGTTSPGTAGIKKDPYQAFIEENVLFGDLEPGASPADFEQVDVPSYFDVARNGAGIGRTVIGAKGILERFESLEAILEQLIVETQANLDPNFRGAAFTPDETQALMDYKKQLDSQLTFCRKQKDTAKVYSDWAKVDEERAKEEAKKESAWWTPESEENTPPSGNAS